MARVIEDIAREIAHERLSRGQVICEGECGDAELSLLLDHEQHQLARPRRPAAGRAEVGEYVRQAAGAENANVVKRLRDFARRKRRELTLVRFKSLVVTLPSSFVYVAVKPGRKSVFQRSRVSRR